MPIDYSHSKIALFTSTDKSDSTYFILPTTKGRAEFLANIKFNYKKFLKGEIKEQDYFKLITDIGMDKLECKIVIEKPLTDKKELNDLLNETKTKLNETTEDTIKENKTDLNETTLNEYIKTIKVIKKKYVSNNPYWYNEANKVIEFIKNYKQETDTKTGMPLAVNTQKNYYKALISITEPNIQQIYRNELNRLDLIYKAVTEQNEMSLKQREKWVEYPIILHNFNKLREQFIQTKIVTKEFLVSCFYAGVYFAPYRVMELLQMKMKNFNPIIDNYIDFDKKIFVLNIYKTIKDYGKLIQKIPSELFNILLYWKNQNKNNTYLLETNNEKIKYAELNKIINTDFGCGASMLRNIFVTHLWTTNKLNSSYQMKKVSTEMRNSTAVMLLYRRQLKKEEQVESEED